MQSTARLLSCLGMMEVRGIKGRHVSGFRPYEISPLGISHAEIFAQQQDLISAGLVNLRYLSKEWSDGRADKVPVLRLTEAGLITYFLNKSESGEGLNEEHIKFLLRRFPLLMRLADNLSHHDVVNLLKFVTRVIGKWPDAQYQDTAAARDIIIDVIERSAVPTLGRRNSEINDDFDTKEDLIRRLNQPGWLSRQTVKDVVIFVLGSLSAIATAAAIADSESVRYVVAALLKWLQTIGMAA